MKVGIYNRISTSDKGQNADTQLPLLRACQLGPADVCGYQDQVPELEENLPDTKKALLRIRGTYTRSEIKKSVDMYTRDVYTVQH